MVEVRFSDEERKTLLTLALHTVAFSDPLKDQKFHDELLAIARKLEGGDTVLVAQRREYWTHPEPKNETE